ncbi:5622_t:CDS:2, partial [Scutellospora calospora]
EQDINEDFYEEQDITSQYKDFGEEQDVIISQYEDFYEEQDIISQYKNFEQKNYENDIIQMNNLQHNIQKNNIIQEIKHIPTLYSTKQTFQKLVDIKQFYHLRFVLTIYKQISPLPLPKNYHPQQFVALSNFYQANLNEPIIELSDWGVKYAKLRTRESYIHGSFMIIVATNTQDNACYELEVNVARPKDPEKYELKQFFGQ